MRLSPFRHREDSPASGQWHTTRAERNGRQASLKRDNKLSRATTLGDTRDRRRIIASLISYYRVLGVEITADRSMMGLRLHR